MIQEILESSPAPVAAPVAASMAPPVAAPVAPPVAPQCNCSFAIPIFLRLCFYNQESIPLQVIFQYCEEKTPEFLLCLETLNSFGLISISSETFSLLQSSFASSPSLSSPSPVTSSSSSSSSSFPFDLLSTSSIRLTPLLQTSICHLISLSIHLQKYSDHPYEERDEEFDPPSHPSHLFPLLPPSVDLSSIYHHIGILYLKSSSLWNEALYLLTKSLQMKERIVKDLHSSSSLWREQRENSLDLHLHAEIAQLYHDIGMTYSCLEQNDLALVKFKQSLDLNLNLFGNPTEAGAGTAAGGGEEVCWEVVMTRFQMGILFLKQKKYEEALLLFDHLLKLQKQLSHSHSYSSPQSPQSHFLCLLLSSMKNDSATTKATGLLGVTLATSSTGAGATAVTTSTAEATEAAAARGGEAGAAARGGEAAAAARGGERITTSIVCLSPSQYLLQTLLTIHFIHEKLGEHYVLQREFSQAIQQYGECLIIKRNILSSSPSSAYGYAMSPQDEESHSADLHRILLLLSAIHSQYGQEFQEKQDYRNCIKQFYESYNSLLACITSSASSSASSSSSMATKGSGTVPEVAATGSPSLALALGNQLIEIGKVRMIQKKYVKSLKCFQRAIEVIQKIETGKGNGKETELLEVTEKVKQQHLRKIQYLIYESQVKRFLMMIIYIFIGILMVGYQLLYRETEKGR
jgi:tetratricopeptide (TPR) repeat protein